MPLKSYTSSTAGATPALNPVIALLKISESSLLARRYSNTGMPVTFSAAGLPVVTVCSISEYTRKWNGLVIQRPMSWKLPGPFRNMLPASVSLNIRGVGSSRSPRLASARITRYSASSSTPVALASSSTGMGSDEKRSASSSFSATWSAADAM
jgi:hypothetical protein